jgi:hypothetical protein
METWFGAYPLRGYNLAGSSLGHENKTGVKVRGTLAYYGTWFIVTVIKFYNKDTNSFLLQKVPTNLSLELLFWKVGVFVISLTRWSYPNVFGCDKGGLHPYSKTVGYGGSVRKWENTKSYEIVLISPKTFYSICPWRKYTKKWCAQNKLGILGLCSQNVLQTSYSHTLVGSALSWV